MPLSNNTQPAGVQPVFAQVANIDVSIGINETNVISVDPINMDYNLFKYLFYYNSSENFSIAKANDAYSLLKFYNFTINGSPLSLVNSFLSAYETNNNTNRNALSPLTNITLVKAMSQYSSVVDVLPYSISLTNTDLISALMDSLVIQPSNSINDYAEVIVLLSVRIFSDVLKTTITFNIPIITNIPGYINPNSVQPPVYIPTPKPLKLPTDKPKTNIPVGKYSYEELQDVVSLSSNIDLQENSEENKLNLNIRENRSTDNSVVDHETSSDDAEVW